MKKAFALLLAAMMMLSMAACGAQKAPDPQPDPTPAINNPPADDPEPDPTAGGKILVVYFAATGSTKAVADSLAEVLGADELELQPVEPYTSADLNWNDAESRVCREHSDETLRSVPLNAATVENWADYDTVLIGYPIWWGIAAWPVNGFVQGHDFSGKTVIPFCTSASSPMGESGQLLAQMAGSGDWQDGKRFGSNATQQEVTDWANSLELTHETE